MTLVLIDRQGNVCARIPRQQERLGAWIYHQGRRFGFAAANTSGEHFYYEIEEQLQQPQTSGS